MFLRHKYGVNKGCLYLFFRHKYNLLEAGFGETLFLAHQTGSERLFFFVFVFAEELLLVPLTGALAT